MSDLDARDAALGALATHLGLRATWTLHQLLPVERWETAGPEGFWDRPEIVAARSDRDQRQIENRLAELIGDEHAATFMAYLPPVPWEVLRTQGIWLRTGAAA